MRSEAAFGIEWTVHERKPRAEIEALHETLQASIAIDGPDEFAVLVYAAQLLETGYAVARLTGYADREPALDHSDIVELFLCLDSVLEALTERRIGLIELYPGPDPSEFIVFDAGPEEVLLYRVPWSETAVLDLERPLPTRVTERPVAACGPDELADQLRSLRGSFARAALEHDPRLAAHEPIRAWARPEAGQ